MAESVQKQLADKASSLGKRIDSNVFSILGDYLQGKENAYTQEDVFTATEHILSHPEAYLSGHCREPLDPAERDSVLTAMHEITGLLAQYKKELGYYPRDILQPPPSEPTHAVILKKPTHEMVARIKYSKKHPPRDGRAR